MTDFEPSGDIKRYVGFDWPKPNCENVSNLTHTQRASPTCFTSSGVLICGTFCSMYLSQCRYINWLANWPCHFQYYDMCIANLKKGGMGPPVSSKLTVDRTVFATGTSNVASPKPRNLGYREPGLPSQCKRSKIIQRVFPTKRVSREAVRIGVRGTQSTKPTRACRDDKSCNTTTEY